MGDIRGIPTTDTLASGRLTIAAALAGFTAGARYWPLAIGVDCGPAQPVVYVLTVNDAGAIVAAPASSFRLAFDNLQP